MDNLPIRPHFKSYGRSQRTREKAIAFNRMAQRVADHVHRLILADESKIQVYSYFEIAQPLGLDVADVRAAIGRGGFNGITFGVNEAERQALAALLETSRNAAIGTTRS